MGTPVTSEQLKEILEGMAKMFQNVASSSSVVVPRSEQIQRSELPPNDIKLEGTRNYLSWSRRAILNLQKRGLDKYVGEY